MTESLMGFTLGVLIVVVASLLWKWQGTARERARKMAALEESVLFLQQDTAGLQRQVIEIRSLPRGTDNGASDAAIAQLSGRLMQLEKAHAAQDLTILETAEKVAHKLQDRRRKRDQAELGDIDDAPNDPAQLLAEARRAYGVTSADPAQLSIIGGE